MPRWEHSPWTHWSGCWFLPQLSAESGPRPHVQHWPTPSGVCVHSHYAVQRWLRLLTTLAPHLQTHHMLHSAGGYYLDINVLKFSYNWRKKSWKLLMILHWMNLQYIINWGLPAEDCALTSASCAIRSLTMSTYPPLAASISGVQSPLIPRSSTLAFIANKTYQKYKWNFFLLILILLSICKIDVGTKINNLKIEAFKQITYLSKLIVTSWAGQRQ